MSIENILNTTTDFKKKFISQDVVVYGAGDFGRICAKILINNGYKIHYFLDNQKYKENETIDGIPVYSPDNIKHTDLHMSCVLGIFNAYVDLADIESTLHDIGYDTILNPLEFHAKFKSDIGDYFWLGDEQLYHENADSLQKIYDLLSDGFSKQLLESILSFRVQKKLALAPVPQDVTAQYFPEDIPVEFPVLSFVDCGAYDGDTILSIVKKKIPLESFAAFEPDIDNIKSLSINMQQSVEAPGVIFPCAVWHCSEQLRFSGGTGSSSHISDQGEVTVQAAAIDEVLVNHPVNFIKMDIEGAEIPALMGAAKTIEKYEPILAISAYHKPDDLWTIPELIFSWNLSYSLYLRVYEYNGFELVYYAIPKQYLKAQ